jgi:hypothetical protein
MWTAVDEHNIVHIVMSIAVDPAIAPALVTGLNEVAEGARVVEHDVPAAMSVALGTQEFEVWWTVPNG